MFEIKIQDILLNYIKDINMENVVVDRSQSLNKNSYFNQQSVALGVNVI